MTSSRLKVLPGSTFSIFPVPTDGFLNLNSNQNLPIQSLRVVDGQGRLLEQMDYSNAVLQQRIDTRSYANGTYFVQIYTEQGFLTKRFLVKRK